MLTENAKLVIEFVEECRSQLMVKDELHETQEEMYKTLYRAEEILKQSEEGKKLFTSLESLVARTLDLTKDVYFEYGENYSGACDNQMLKRYKEAV
ncbi:hypothetical protein [uncultured Tyzzerella sp.]|uniref:hypothetical protein n=1 Tax=uncultured Tyzzerella sp. TaxID=2321398 RepID=UPI0029437434|nr:hypothetical protein [uncultured Tyzzerella sp.]